MARLRQYLSWVRPIDLVLALGSLVALRALLWHGLEPLGPFDEGLLFANAQMMGDGRVPYRDFYSNYPPGVFQLVRAALTFTAAPISTMRWLSFATHLSTAIICARLVARAQRRVWCIATFCFVLVIQADLGLVPYAYTFAVLLLLSVLLIWPSSAAACARTYACALLLGVLTYLRHDVFIYAALPAVLLESAWWLSYKRSLLFSGPRQLGTFAAVMVATALCLWGPIFAQAGVSRVVHDLFLDQVGVVMAARTLPVPPMLGSAFVPSLSMPLPWILSDPTRFGLALLAICVPAAGYQTTRQLLRGRWSTPRAALAVLCLACALGTLPQAFGRTDYWHVAFGVPLVAVAGFRAIGLKVTQTISLLSLLLLIAQTRPLISEQDLERLWLADDAFFVTPERRELTALIVRETKPGQAVFIGCRSHRRPMMSIEDLYYLAHRPGATRYMQFDPGLIREPEKQREMIADLERTKPPIILRWVGCLWNESNDSMREGSTLLDDYLQHTFVAERTLYGFDIWRRRK